MAGRADTPDSDESALEHHVDEMMDPKLADPKPAPGNKKTWNPSGAPALKPIDIFAAKTPASTPVKLSGLPPRSGAAKQDAADDALQPSDLEGLGTVHSAPASANLSAPIKANTGEQIASDPSIENASDDELIDDIVANEGNALLAAQDAEISRAFSSGRPSFWSRSKDFFGAWWDNKTARYSTLGGLLILLGAAGLVPQSRYFVLNTAGMRTAATLRVLDSTTDLPLKNVSVSIGSQHFTTAENGFAAMNDVKYGTQQLTVEQPGFARVAKTVTLGFGSNELEQMELKATGTQFSFAVTDYVSGKPIAAATAVSGQNAAKADNKGKIVLTLGHITGPTMDVTFTADGYRNEKVTINTATPGLSSVSMTTKHQEVYVTKQSGKYDVYKSDVDGKNKKQLLAGTGRERPQISLVQDPADDTAALVSSRDDKRDADGYLLDILTLININDGSTISLDASERIQLVDWIGDRLIYIKIKAGTSAGNSQRYQLISYDTSNTNRQVLASANYFNDIVSAKGIIYFSTSNNYYPGGQNQFVKINPDNTSKQVLQTAEIYNILRNSYDTLDLAAQNKWFSYHLGDAAAKEAANPPADTNDSRFYLDGPDGKHSLWTESRDGKGVLLVYNNATGQDTTLAAQSGLSYPLQWLDARTVVYRVQTPQETAAYVVSLDGGKPKKIADITGTFGFGKFGYYY